MKSVLLIAILAVGVYSQGWSGLSLTLATTGCQANCSACLTAGTSVSQFCAAPASGQIVSGAVTCTAGANNSQALAANGTVITCMPGYYLSSGNCTACSQTSAFSCTGSTNSTVTACMTPGYIWTSAAGCTVLAAGTSGVYWLNANGSTPTVAIPAATACLGIDGNNLGICVNATLGSFPFVQTSSGNVSSAVGNASFTTSVSNCLFGSYANSTNVTCVQCVAGQYPSVVATNVITTCAANPTATSNLSAYLANANGGAGAANGTAGYIPWCVAYILGSANSSQSTCQACSQGFTPSSTKAICIPCSGNFTASCPWAGLWAGYYWNTSAWIICPNNTLTCVWFNGAVQASTCATGFAPLLTVTNNTGQVACSAVTSAPTDTKALFYYGSNWASAACQAGYYLAVQTIVQCGGAGSMACSGCMGNAMNCTACNTGYTYTAGSNTTNGTCASSSSNSSNKTSGSLILSGLAFFSAILYYFI